MTTAAPNRYRIDAPHCYPTKHEVENFKGENFNPFCNWFSNM